MAVLSQIQEHLQDIYELDIAQNVYDYLVTDNEYHGAHLPVRRDQCRERLLLLQDEEELHLSLYLHHGIVKNLAQHDSEFVIHHGNLEDFCLALEGISHFLYVIWNARYKRSIILLEMELQAEVDKFILLSRYLGQQGNRLDSGQLRHLLFGSSGFSAMLTTEELQRYRDASNFAGQYCWHLETSYSFRKGRERELLSELRRFYRLGPGDKLRRIHSAY